MNEYNEPSNVMEQLYQEKSQDSIDRLAEFLKDGKMMRQIQKEKDDTTKSGVLD